MLDSKSEINSVNFGFCSFVLSPYFVFNNFYLISNRRRKLTELSANEKEIVGYYTAFIPISKIALNMPIGKVDNITVVNNKFFWFTGKMIRIGSASGVIKIRYVLNADEVVAFISEAIEKAKNKREQAISHQISAPQTDAADSIRTRRIA